jgi:hypothetical protein
MWVLTESDGQQGCYVSQSCCASTNFRSVWESAATAGGQAAAE